MIFLFSFLICFGMFAVTSNCTIDSRLPNGDEVASYAADADRLTIEIFRILASLAGFLDIIGLSPPRLWHSWLEIILFLQLLRLATQKHEREKKNGKKSSKSICEMRRQIENCFTSSSHISPPLGLCMQITYGHCYCLYAICLNFSPSAFSYI